MRLIGIAQHAPLHVRQMIEAVYEAKSKPCKVFVLPLNGSVRMKAATSCDVLFITRYADFIRNLDDLNHKVYADKPVFLFTSVLRLSEIKPITVLDSSRLTDFSFRLTTLSKADIAYACFRSVPQKKVRIADKDFLASLIADNMQGSLLTPLMTLIYQVAAPQQSLLKNKIFEWLLSDDSVNQLQQRFKAGTLEPKFAKQLFDFLSSDVVTPYRDALRFVQQRTAAKKPISYKQVMRKFPVTSYEIRYILSVLVRDKKNTELYGKTLEEIFFSRERNAKMKAA